MSTPVVSVVTITYNQDKYIEQALESFVRQKTNFKFEVIVSDDASTDATPDIIRRYAEKYPNIIKPVLRNKNIGAVANSIDTLKRAKGKYIALCEGDDYWIDDEKLQLQVDFLERRSDYAVCFHKTKVIFEKGEEETIDYPFRTDNFTLTKLIEENFIQTNSVVYRRTSYASLSSGPFPFDWYLHLYHAKTGKIGFINRTMSVYRRHEGGMWWIAYSDFDLVWEKYSRNFVVFLQELMRMYGNDTKLRPVVEQKVFSTMQSFADTDSRKGGSIFSDTIGEFAEITKIYAEFASKLIKDLEIKLAKMQVAGDLAEVERIENERQIETLSNERDTLRGDVKDVSSRLNLIETSRTWRLRKKLHDMLKGVKI